MHLAERQGVAWRDTVGVLIGNAGHHGSGVRAVDDVEAQAYANRHHMHFFIVSTMDGTGTDDLLASITNSQPLSPSERLSVVSSASSTFSNLPLDGPSALVHGEPHAGHVENVTVAVIGSSGTSISIVLSCIGGTAVSARHVRSNQVVLPCRRVGVGKSAICQRLRGGAFLEQHTRKPPMELYHMGIQACHRDVQLMIVRCCILHRHAVVLLPVCAPRGPLLCW